MCNITIFFKFVTILTKTKGGHTEQCLFRWGRGWQSTCAHFEFAVYWTRTYNHAHAFPMRNACDIIGTLVFATDFCGIDHGLGRQLTAAIHGLEFNGNPRF